MSQSWVFYLTPAAHEVMQLSNEIGGHRREIERLTIERDRIRRDEVMLTETKPEGVR